MLKNRIVYVLVLFGLFLFYIFCNSYVSVYIIYLLLAMTIISGVLAFYSAKGVTASVMKTLSAANVENRLIEFCAVVQNDSFLPVPAAIFDIDLQDMAESGSVHRRIRTSLASHDSKDVYLSVSAPYAAVAEAKVSRVRVCDCFGVFSFRVKQENRGVQVLISPSAKPQKKHYRKLSQSVADSDVYSDIMKGDDRSQVFELRDYKEGDDLRNVHWPLSARRGTLIVKDFSLPIEQSCVVLLETSLADEVSDVETVKIRVDALLAEFSGLASQLLESGQPFTVQFYSHKIGKNVELEVKNFEDISIVFRAFLLEKPSGESMRTYLSFFDDNIDRSSAVYYICDPSVEGFTEIEDSESLAVIKTN